MSAFNACEVSPSDDLQFQEYMLQHVSRTFALTIPQLPAALVPVVGNAYLLCRIADTIEDDAGLEPDQKQSFSETFLATLEEPETAHNLEKELSRNLKSATAAEHYLMTNISRVVGIYGGFSLNQRVILKDCVQTMTRGMSFYQQSATQSGCEDIAALNSYCYHVAGVVGEMLTGLFCEYSLEIKKQASALMCLAVSFGQGLQMTNILKDFSDDLARGVCWLPSQVFAEGAESAAQNLDQTFVVELISIAHGHLQDALDYTLLIPENETGIRKFCLWGIGMALLTLRKVYSAGSPDIANHSAKISRAAVKLVITGTRLSVHSNELLRREFEMLSRGLPPAVNNPLDSATLRAAVSSALD